MSFVDFLNDDDSMASGIPGISAYSPKKMVHFHFLFQEVMRGPSAFTPEQRELLSIYVSANNSCSYCAGSHRMLAKSMGVDPVLLEQMIEDLDSSPVEEKLKPVLKYVKKLTLTPYKMVQGDADAVSAAGWDSDALSDAIFVCGIMNLANRLIQGHGVSGAVAKKMTQEEIEEWRDDGYIPENYQK